MVESISSKSISSVSETAVADNSLKSSANFQDALTAEASATPKTLTGFLRPDNVVLGNNDTLLMDNSVKFTDGTSGNDTLTATTSKDLILGRDGNDTIKGGAGNDTLFGGNGEDVITGGGGADAVYGGAGNDSIDMAGSTSRAIVAGSGDDTITNISGFANVDGGPGNDTVSINGNKEDYTVWRNVAPTDTTRTVSDGSFDSGYTGGYDYQYTLTRNLDDPFQPPSPSQDAHFNLRGVENIRFKNGATNLADADSGITPFEDNKDPAVVNLGF